MAEHLSGRLEYHVFIEKVHAMPAFGKDKNGNDKRQGITSMFRFGEGFGLWIGIIAALGLPCTQVAPQTWKKALMAGMPDKDASRQRAQELYPQCVKDLSRKKDHNRAEALLLAHYGKITTRGQ
jgi:crossover junction endodeoxyribonuclease RuvC